MTKINVYDYVAVPHDDETLGRQVRLGRVVEIIKNPCYPILKVQLSADEIIEIAEPLVDKIQNADNFTIIQHVSEESKGLIFECPARELAAEMLNDAVLTTDDYYAMEDFITDFLNGDETELPNINHRMAILINYVEAILTTESFNEFKHQIEDKVDFRENVAKVFTGQDWWHKEPKLHEVEAEMLRYLAYTIFLKKWEISHDSDYEKAPCYEEFLDNEFENEECIKYYEIGHIKKRLEKF